MTYTLQQAIELLQTSFGANLDPAQELNLVCEKYMNMCDPPGSLERVTFTVTTDANGQGFITLPSRYQAIRGAVTNCDNTFISGSPNRIQNQWFEYGPGNLGMVTGSDPLRGIIPVTPQQTDVSSNLPPVYKVPATCGTGSLTYFTAICKVAFVILENDTDILPIQNLNALEIGLLARAHRRAREYKRESEAWQQGVVELMGQKDNITGAEAYGSISYRDDFSLNMLSGYGSYDGGWGGWGWGWGNW